MAQTTRHEPRNTASTRPHTELAVADGAQVAPAPLHSWTPVSVRATFLRDGELRPPIRVGTNRSGAGRRRDRVIADLAAKAHADSTRRAYGRHVAKWVDWAEAHGFCPLPAPADAFVEYIVAYTLELDEEGVPLGVEEGAFEGRVVSSTLNQMVSAIALLHSLAGLPSPTHDPYVCGVVTGLRRVLTSAPEYAAGRLPTCDDAGDRWADRAIAAGGRGRVRLGHRCDVAPESPWWFGPAGGR